ncbi:DeoR family transcriptional regulator [Paenibacillus sp. 32O-W]|uniref:GntR family transcriptional regulator n=1 Tax=Paenibacillus cisolokensis TaxID=1658519 RepID=A0ABQ4N4P7_9BACL|nr:MULTISPECIES: DeoR/GlpR family DNA-binding transcription regulator [Paenibacillus]ALS25986.1 DeoR family transcriptional regulator [Paenibacillus sp. 32O-W]GIQ63193.1 GntR family transcriptional regulator [Paenibacillus cisolokensis]
MGEQRKQRKMRSLERQQFILDYLKSHKSVDVSFLSSALSVSEVTVRKDLEKLEQDNWLIRSHGGAVLNEKLFIEPSFVEKEDRLAAEKSAIAAEAAKLIRDGMVVAIAPGTTAGRITEHIRDRSSLTVVTNAVNVATALMGRPGIELFMTGGRLRPNTFALIGETAEKSLDGVYTEYVFFGANGFGVEKGFTTPSMEEARVVRKLIDNARHVVALVDHSKFDTFAFYRIVDSHQVHTVITDSKAPPDQLDQLRERGIRVIVT